MMILVHLLFFVGMVWSAGMVYENNKDYEQLMNEVYKESLVKNKAIGIFTPNHSGKIDALSEIAMSYHDRVKFFGISFLIIATIYIGLVACMKNISMLCGSILLVSSISLTMGLILPVFSVVLHKTVPVLGRVVFKHETIGILSAIQSWWSSGNYFISLIVLLFSFAIPVLKSASMGFIVGFPDTKSSQKMLKIFKIIGSWSMLDVFVVAVVIVVVTVNGKDSTKAMLEVGLYFFLAYVMLSIVATQLLSLRRDKSAA